MPDKRIFALHKEEPPNSCWVTRVYVDLGYHGLDKIHEATELPYKNYKANPLDSEKNNTTGLCLVYALRLRM